MQAVSLTAFASVAAGGAIGASLRYAVGLWTLRAFGPAFPWGTLIVNVVGSFLIACVVEFVATRAGAGPALRLFLATGVLGGFTTFSAFSLDTLALAERGETGLAFLYVVGSVGLSVGACLAGLVLARSVL